MRPRQRVIVYVDGFNLYYGCLKGTPYRWLDLGALASRMVPGDEVVGIKYFTALVKDRPGDEDLERRQKTYLRALATVPNLTVHLGHFMTRPVIRAVVNPPKRGPKFREVWQTEEKGSDVNLASHLLIDGFRARYDLAVVISNDSDLKEPIRFVREDLKAPVGVLNPHTEYRSWALSPRKLPRGSFYKPIRVGALASSQFPDEVQDAKGAVRRPKRWKGLTP
ncbi:MAG: NYN domain-containing protein [Thermoleophilaceae bacterium]